MSPAPVHTTGINWDSLSLIIGTIVVVVGAVGGFIRRSIKTSVDNLAEVLTERLETKATVAALATKVAVLEERAKGTAR